MRFLVLLIALALAGAYVGPRALDAVALHRAADDPVALSDLQLREALDAARIAAEIDAALAAEDAELAASFVALADERGVAVDAERRARVAAAEKTSPARLARDAARGFAFGEADTVSGLAGAVAGDVVGYGDLRDLVREGSRALRGEAADELVLGLSVVGLAITGATWASLGVAAPARAGITSVKSAVKAGRLSRPLKTVLTRATREAVDGEAVRGMLGALRRFDLGAARAAAQAAVRPGALGRLRGLADDAAVLYAKTGHRGAQQALSLAESGDDLARAARLAAARGPRTRAILKTLGRGALVLGGLSLTLAGWILSAVGAAFSLAWTLSAMGVALARSLGRRRRRGSGAVPSARTATR